MLPFPRVATVAAFLVLAALVVPAFSAPSNPFVRQFPASGKLEFKLEDKLHLPAFAWPRTLLSYAVQFSGSKVRAGDLHLRDLSSGKEVPVQLSEIWREGEFVTKARVNFFSDLPSGGARRFELTAGAPSPESEVGVKVTKETGTIVLDAGKLKVRIPDSREFPAGTLLEKVPGPILQLNRGTGWMGGSTLVSPKRAVKSLKTQVIEQGPLFVACRVSYRFEGGPEYSAIVKAIANYDYIEFHEEMRGLTKEDGVYVENAWTNFRPTHRMSCGSPFGGIRRVDEPMTQAFRGEDPAFTGPTRVEDVAVEMLASLTPYWPNGSGGNREAAFWDEKSGDGLGVFITDAGKWQDHEYAIWTSADTLKVKFRYANGTLFWKWPLVNGTRFTGITSYLHGAPKPESDVASASQPENSAIQDDSENPGKQKELPNLLRIQYADISLDRVKDWILEYPDSAARPPLTFKGGRKKSVAEFMAALPTCATAAVAGGMFHPVALRDMGYWVVPDFNRYAAQMTPEQRSQATALLLFSAYVSASEEFSPMLTMLGGHPNFMADLKFPMAAAAALFPEHPMAGEWSDQFEKFMELSGHFYVRPAVPQWKAKAGRWTESIATYNWAFLSPSTEANRLALAVGTRNVFASPQLADMADYITGSLTAPQSLDAAKTEWPDNTALTPENGFKRIHPPQGAHSGKRVAGGTMYLLGEQLQRYRPLTAEHLMWAGSSSAGEGFEDRAGEKTGDVVNRGTNPHLTSAKYTGYGVVLRAGVDTPDEISVYLQQVDKGPNYRWGYANQNGSGDIYYYAKGKSFSGHGFEDAGDRHADDALYSCNTGVYKDYHFQCIGMNELTQPFYNLEVAQFAELVPQKNPKPYSWPEYQSRSVMLMGTEYIVTYDAILDPCGTRFAWNSAGVHDELPFIYPLKGGGENVMDTASRARDKQRGILFDVWKGGGDRMMLVTHLAGVKVIAPKLKRKQAPPPFYCIQTPTGEDAVFQNSSEIDWSGEGMTFRGKAGTIRHRKNGQTELALFHGTEIGDKGVTLKTDNPALGISVAFANPGEASGAFFSREGGTVTLSIAAEGRGTFYVDGAALAAMAPGQFKFPPGAHRWEYTAHSPEPMPPTILRTENASGQATVFFTHVAGAENYRLETSSDNGASWKSAGETTGEQFALKGLTNGSKLHVRVIAVNRDRTSRPANDYPIYVTDKPLPAPDGLKSALSVDSVSLTWGEMLGVKEYRLYRRPAGQGEYKEIHHGLETSYADTAVRVQPAFADPGLKASVMRIVPTVDDQSGLNSPVYEYVVTAVNGNGESARSIPADTNPASWRNWNPSDDLRFKRQSAFWLPPYVTPEEVPPPYYPAAEATR